MILRIAFSVDSVPFTPDVIAGTASLGGSESACLGLARALRARGHEVHIFATKLAEDAPLVDHAGVQWHPLSSIDQGQIVRDFDVLVALRMCLPLTTVPAKLRILWNQDLLLPGQMQHHIMGCAWAFDRVSYVSKFHRLQWEGILPELAPIGYETRNGYDPAHVPTTATKRPNQIIHISRPERGLAPLLAMWPKLRALRPDAELKYCRYDSMYDPGPGGWHQVVSEHDRAAQRVNELVGGITCLGALGKAELYRAIAESAVMWYPGVHDFAETSCIAAVEAQANGTPFVGSFKGALPETVPEGILIDGNALTDELYHEMSVRNVAELLDGCKTNGFDYRRRVNAGKAHVKRYTYAAIAAEWEQWLLDTFQARYASNKPAILRTLLNDDDHTVAKIVAQEVGDTEAEAFCDRVIAGKDHTADQYAAHACNPIEELRHCSMPGGRVEWLIQSMQGRTRILDVACGSGAFALALAKADPERHIVAVDYAQGNIDALKTAAEGLGVSSQITAICAPIWDYDRQAPSDWLLAFHEANGGTFDGLWCGEFIEHVAACTELVDVLETFVKPDGQVCYSCPWGPMADLVDRHNVLHKGHVHHFRAADVEAVFGAKAHYSARAIPWGPTPRGAQTGNWVIRYTSGAAKTGSRPVERRMLLRPYQTVTAAILCDQTLDVRRCLDAVWPIVDEILIGDTGLSAYDRQALLTEFPRKTRIVPVGAVREVPDGFAGARNILLDAAKGDWLFWIDCDEHLLGGLEVRSCLDGPVFTGFAIAQNHLHIDQPMTKDTPVRIFRLGRDIRFYGCVHEQPQMGDCNGDIVPCLQINNVQIAHTGYLHESARRHKALNRNMELLIRDQERYPDRIIGHLITLREHANLAMWAREKAKGALSGEAQSHYRKVITIFERCFSDPTNRYHGVARQFYESALQCLEGAMEIEIAIAGQQGGLKGHSAAPARFWARTADQVEDMLKFRVAEALKPLHPPTLDVAPVTGRSWQGAAEAPREAVPA